MFLSQIFFFDDTKKKQITTQKLNVKQNALFECQNNQLLSSKKSRRRRGHSDSSNSSSDDEESFSDEHSDSCDKDDDDFAQTTTVPHHHDKSSASANESSKNRTTGNHLSIDSNTTDTTMTMTPTAHIQINDNAPLAPSQIHSNQINANKSFENCFDVTQFSRSCVGSSKYLVNAHLNIVSDDDLVFESRFESGNLAKAIKITSVYYELYLRPDLYTNKHTQWFYFRVTNVKKGITYRYLMA